MATPARSSRHVGRQRTSSVLSPKFVEPTGDRMRSPSKKENAYGSTRTPDPDRGVECGRMQGTRRVGPPSKDGAGDRPASAIDPGMRHGEDEHRGGPRA